MGQGDGDRFRKPSAPAVPGPTYYDKGIAKFDKSGLLGGELFNGLTFEKSALESYRNTQIDAWVAAQESQQANRLFGRNKPIDRSQAPVPFAEGGNVQSFKFGSDGKLYGVVGQRTSMDVDGNQTSIPEMIEMTGLKWDTSTLPKGDKGMFYDAKIKYDPNGNLLELKNNGTVVGWARSMIQRQLEPDSRLGGGSSRTASPGVDSRVANTLLGGPIGDPRKVTTKG